MAEIALVKVPLPTYVNVSMNIEYKEKDGKVIIPEFMWEFEPLLLSAGFWYKYVLYEKKGKLIIDSAGFFYGGKQKLHFRNEFYKLREKFYRWQCLYGDYIVAGDLPISLTKDFKFIKECLLATIDNTELQFRLGAEGRFVNVVHGHSQDIIKLWYKGVKDYPSIGWALGSSLKTTVYGFGLQLLVLYELGAFKKPLKIFHCLGAVSKNVTVGMHYLIGKLGVQTDMLSFDASSSSAERFGILLSEDGEQIGFEEIRRKEKTAKLWDGRIITTAPAVLHWGDRYDYSRTNITNATKFWNKTVRDCCAEKGEDYYKIVTTSGAELIWQLYKEGGIGLLEKELDRRGLMAKVRNVEHKDVFRIL